MLMAASNLRKSGLMSKLTAWVIVPFGLLLFSRSGEATVIWTGDFETGDTSQWDSTNLPTTGDRQNLIIVNEPVIEGLSSCEITLYEDVIFEPYNQSRVEVKHIGLHTTDGEDSYFAWSFMVPDAAEIRSNIGYWESLSSNRNTMTFWIEPEGDTTVVKFGTGNLGETERWSAPLVLGAWHRMAISNHWSQDENEGTVSVWYDGEQVVTAASVAKYDANELFFQMGLHRSDPAPPIQMIYLDAAIEADSLDDILAPLPVSNGGAGGAAGASGSAGASGAGGAAGAGGASGTAGAAGAAAGNGGVAVGGSAGALGGAGASAAGADTAMAGGGSGGTVAQIPAVPASGGQLNAGGAQTSTTSSPESSSCRMQEGARPGSGGSLLLLVGAAWALRRKRTISRS